MLGNNRRGKEKKERGYMELDDIQKKILKELFNHEGAGGLAEALIDGVAYLCAFNSVAEGEYECLDVSKHWVGDLVMGNYIKRVPGQNHGAMYRLTELGLQTAKSL